MLETILKSLDTLDLSSVNQQQTDKKASDNEYSKIVRDVDADTPARYNADQRCLHEASGCAGKLVVFAARLDTYPKNESEKVFYIGTNHLEDLTQIRRTILSEFNTLPVSGEYMHRDIIDITEKYGKDTVLMINMFGTQRLPTFFALKNAIDTRLNKIKIFAQYIDTEKDPLTLPPPVFDTVLIAGDTSFILQVAPILSYYDLGPDRALFIGIDRWNIPKMLNEPSLQNAILTLPTRPADEKFNKVWESEFKIDSNDLARISFDATALVIATANINSDASLSERLVGQPGFIGFSGQFKMSRTGLTERIFEIMKISDNLLIKPSIQ